MCWHFVEHISVSGNLFSFDRDKNEFVEYNPQPDKE